MVSSRSFEALSHLSKKQAVLVILGVSRLSTCSSFGETTDAKWLPCQDHAMIFLRNVFIRLNCPVSTWEAFFSRSLSKTSALVLVDKLTEIYSLLHFSSFSFILLHWFLGNFTGMFWCGSANREKAF